MLVQVCTASGTDYYLKTSAMQVFLPTSSSYSDCSSFTFDAGLSLPTYDYSLHTPSGASDTLQTSTTHCFSFCNMADSSGCEYLKKIDGDTNAMADCNTAA